MTDEMKTVYKIYRPTDFSEGRSRAADVDVWESKQDAWDEVNELRGVQGSHPSKWGRACGRFDTWQAYNEATGEHGDYMVTEVKLHPASDKTTTDAGAADLEAKAEIFRALTGEAKTATELVFGLKMSYNVVNAALGELREEGAIRMDMWRNNEIFFPTDEQVTNEAIKDEPNKNNED